jgi:hypothetical protein
MGASIYIILTDRDNRLGNVWPSVSQIPENLGHPCPTSGTSVAQRKSSLPRAIARGWASRASMQRTRPRTARPASKSTGTDYPENPTNSCLLCSGKSSISARLAVGAPAIENSRRGRISRLVRIIPKIRLETASDRHCSDSGIASRILIQQTGAFLATDGTNPSPRNSA